MAVAPTCNAQYTARTPPQRLLAVAHDVHRTPWRILAVAHNVHTAYNADVVRHSGAPAGEGGGPCINIVLLLCVDVSCSEADTMCGSSGSSSGVILCVAVVAVAAA